MALGRIVEVLVGPSDPVNILGTTTATRVSDLDLSFNIVRSNTLSQNKANFTIYNASEDTRKNILKVDNNVLFYAGYEDEKNKALVYAGNISQVFTERDGGEWVTKIKATSYRAKNKNEGTVNVSLSFDKEVAMDSVIQELATLMGVSVRGVRNTSLLTLPNGFHYVGTASGCLKYCKLILEAAQLSVTIDNEDMFIYRPGYVFVEEEVLSAIEATESSFARPDIFGPPTIPNQKGTLGISTAPLLSFNDTLLNVKEKSKSKTWQSLLSKNGTNKQMLEVNALLDPRLVPNGGLFLDTKKYNGEYVINQSNFYGDNFGGDFNCKLKVQSVA